MRFLDFLKNVLLVIILVSFIVFAFFLGRKSNDTGIAANHEIKNTTKFNESDATPETSIDCRPPVNSKHNNYVIGYGSLMNKDSRMLTVPDSEYAPPVLVKGFERIWASRGTSSRATYLLAIPNPGYMMNAIYYPSTASDIQATDLREASYCRVKVDRKDILPFGIKSLPRGDFWMYVKSFSDAEFPTKVFPILQSYADVFMTGCLQTQKDFQLSEYGQLCFDTTYNWDLANWMNDRPNPRYARYSDNVKPYQRQIDSIISRINVDTGD